MADIIVANAPMEATIEASIDTAMMDAEMNSDSNIELALEVTTWGGSNSRANLDNYLAKDNEMPYEPVGFYNPATKGYVDINALIHRTGEELFNTQESITGVVFCTEGYGDYFLEGGVYEYENGELIKVIELSGVGGTTNQSETITPLELNTAVGQPTILEYDFKSKSSGKGTAKLFINGVLKSSKIISKGVNSFDITEYIKEGSNYFTVTITDGSNNVISFDYIVNGVKITVKSSFNEAQVYTGDVIFSYSVIGAGLKTVTFVVDNEEIGTAEIKTSGEQSKYTITGLTHGGHVLKVKATTIINEILIESNELICQILYAEEGITTPIVSSTFSKTEALEGEMLNIDYLIYDPLNATATAYFQINDEEPTVIQVNRTKQYWGVSKYPVGETVFKIGCGDVEIQLPVTVTELEMDIEPVEDDLSLYLSAANRSNAESEETRSKWIYNDIVAEFTNVNWISNGWMNNTFKLTGEAYGYIPYNVFAGDARSTGKTIEIEFATHNIKNYESVLLSCFAEGKGIQITATEAILKSEQEEVKVRFKEGEKVRVSFVIESENDNKLIKTYVDGVLSGLVQYDSTDNFQQGAPVGITLNEGKEEIDIYTIRAYDIALSSRQILNNYICDLTDVTEKIAKYQSNNIYDIYGSISMAKIKSMIPILTITGELPPVKGEKKTVSTTFNDPYNPQTNFTKENCIIDIQGTSSQYYPKKNYKIKFPEAFSFYEGAIPEAEYTFKADYMESSHSHNTGNAILVNDLYEEFFPTQTAENGVRNTIYGFPCAIYYRINDAADYEYFGAYNFNNDKGNAATLGLVGDKAQSWEFKNNTSTHCLLRNDDFSPEAKPEDNFEARYPDKYTDYTDLQRVVSWIVSTDGDLEKFKSEFNQYFNLHYCLIYYVMLEWGLMMDSRAKNMFFDTIDGNIWYPRMYDMDTCYGLNNEGVLNFGYGLEQHDENIYNGENSLFWNNFEQCYSTEIKDMYLSLRANGKLSYDTMMRIFKQGQVDKISEAQFNADAQFKYISPIIEDNDTTYAYVAQGTRISHFEWWVTNRIKYLDSKFETPEYLADFMTMRMYTNNGTFSLTPYIDQYLKIRYGSSDVKVRGAANTSTLVPCPSGLVFNDTETIIYGAENISSLGDLSTKYPGTVDVSKGVKLSELKIGDSSTGYSNKHLTTLTLGNNRLLRTIDVSNCPNLVGNLDVSGCTALREFKAIGSGLKGVTFVDGGDLTTLELPTTLTNLTVKNHINLTSIQPSTFDSLQTLVLKNTKVDASNILMANYKSLNRIYCVFEESANVKLSNFVLNYILNNCQGIDDNGMNTENPNIQGYITVEYPSSFSSDALEAMKERYATKLPYLNITYVSTTLYYSYNSSYNRLEFCNPLSKNLPETVSFPDREELEESLGISAGLVNENTIFYLSNTSSNYKSTLKTIILPEGYASYSLYGSYFSNLKKIVFPSGPAKITNFQLFRDSYQGILWDGIVDFSNDNLEIAFSYFNNEYYSTSTSLYQKYKGMNFKNKTFKSYIYGYNNVLGNSYFLGGFVRPWSGAVSNGMYFDTTNFDGITVDSANITTFGRIQDSTTMYLCRDGKLKFSGKNMVLKQMKYFDFSGVQTYGEIDISGTYAPAVTRLTMMANNQTTNTTSYISPYNNYTPYSVVQGSGYPDFLKKISIRDISMPNLTDMRFSFNTNLVEIDMNLNTSGLTSIKDLFKWCKSLKEEAIPFEVFDTSNVTNMNGVFSHCEAITGYPRLNLWDFTNVTTSSGMFEYNKLITSFNLDYFTPAALTSAVAMFYGNANLESVSLPNLNTSFITSFKGMFGNNPKLTNIDLKFDFSSATDLSDVFSGCSLLESIDVISEDAPNVTSVSGMFKNCYAMTHLGGLEELPLSQVTNFSYFLQGCKQLKNISLLTDAKPTNISYMFNNANAESISLPNLDTTEVTSCYYLFANNPEITNYELGENFRLIKPTSYSYMFYNSAIANFDLNRIDTSNATDLAAMFYNCKLTDKDIEIIKTWDTSKVTNLSEMFRGAYDGEVFSLAGLNLSSVTSIDNMLSDNPNLKEIDITGADLSKLSASSILNLLTPNTIEKVDTSQIEGFSGNFTYTSSSNYIYTGRTALKELIIPNVNWTLARADYTYFWSDSPLEKMSLGTVTPSYYYNANQEGYWWKHHRLCSGRTTLKEFSIKNLVFNNTKTFINLSSFFSGCTSLKSFDFGETETSYNTSLYAMFYNCKSIEDVDLSWMTTTSVTNMSHLFYGCSSLKTFNLSNFNWQSVTTITHIFGKCTSLEDVTLVIPDAPKLVTADDLFHGCTNLKTVDLTNADLDLITTMSHWFYKCTSLEEIDLSYLNIPKVTSFYGLFRECTKIKKIDLSCITTTANVNAQLMFENCQSLEELDIRNWQINKITTAANYTNIFTNVPYTCKFIVKDESCRTWLKARNSAFNNIVLVSEL